MLIFYCLPLFAGVVTVLSPCILPASNIIFLMDSVKRQPTGNRWRSLLRVYLF